MSLEYSVQETRVWSLTCQSAQNSISGVSVPPFPHLARASRGGPAWEHNHEVEKTRVAREPQCQTRLSLVPVVKVVILPRVHLRRARRI